MEVVHRIIFECIDAALDNIKFFDKVKFYEEIESSYGLKREDIGGRYSTFHKALGQKIGSKHYAIESLVLKILKARTKEGIYSQIDNIVAFNTITDAIVEETRNNVEVRRNFATLQKYANSIKKEVIEQDKRLHDAERFIAIGETASMVGHDIRNPLQAISSDLYLIQEDLKNLQGEKQGILESLSSINENIAYISKIVADLQDYAKPLNPNLQTVNISKIINDVFSSTYVPEQIFLELEVESLDVKTDPYFIRRILTNLVINAVQAMPSGGQLTIDAHEKDKRLILTVSDTGNGIPEEVKVRMFKPLVTTKSKGQGLGLAVVKRLVDSLQGSINFESEEGKGTKFIIQLPIKE